MAAKTGFCTMHTGYLTHFEVPWVRNDFFSFVTSVKQRDEILNAFGVDLNLNISKESYLHFFCNLPSDNIQLLYTISKINREKSL